MNPDILVATGGLGLFLLGMLLLTEGLRALTGSTLRRLLHDMLAAIPISCDLTETENDANLMRRSLRDRR